MATKTADWRERYLQLAADVERDQANRAAGQRELTRLITRLCVAFSGIDPALDPHLDRLRQAVKDFDDADGLPQQTRAIAETLLHAAEKRAEPHLLQRLLERGGLGEAQRKEVVALWTGLSARPMSVSDQQLDDLAAHLRAGFGEAPQSEERPGLLARLIGKGAGDSAAGPNRLLLDVLEGVKWPDSLAGQAEEFCAELSADAGPEAWKGVVRRISDLAVQAMDRVQQEARSAETFLNALNQRLEELDAHMLGEVRRREDSRESGERLGQQMSSEVDNLSASVRESADLAQLRSSVIASLDRMQSHVRSHLEEENTRREAAETEAADLRSRLRRLEQDTFDLRRQVAQNQAQAMSDALTGLPNRRAYEQRIQQEYARWRRFGEPLALVVWDVDNFKGINDTFGHKSGDKALAMIAKILRSRLRETDFVARYGGEEFVTLLTGADGQAALQVADAMRTAVEDGGLHANGQPVAITLSGGLSVFAKGDDPEDVFERADRAMYQAKRQGKNTVVRG